MWRKASYRQLKVSHPQIGRAGCNKKTVESLNTFRERVDFAVESDAMKGKTFAEKLQTLIDHAKSKGFLQDEAEQNMIAYIQSLVTASAANQPAESSQHQHSDAVEGEQLFSGEQVQEQETEQETEQEIEQEKEEVLEIEQEVEEYVKQKYTRDDETPKPWALESLAAEPGIKSQGFFPCSEFAVLKKLTVKPKPMLFPQYLHISRNHYDPGWSFTTKRRLKNFICVMEYIPDSSALSYGVDDAESITAEQLTCLRRIFSIFDGDGDGGIDRGELGELMRAVGVDMDADGMLFLDEMMAKSQQSLISFEQVTEMMQQQTFFRVQTGRHTVALSLIEAASLRAVLHMREDSPLEPTAPNMSACLRIVAPTSFGKVIGASHNFVPSATYQREIANNCFRFMDSENHFAEDQLNLLLRAVQRNACADRIDWFNDVVQCRRRVQKPWERTQLARLFTTADQYQFIESRALRFRIRSLVKQKGMFVRDAFRAFNVSDTGVLTCSEFYSGLCWLGLNIDVPQLHDIVRSIDSDSDGLISFGDFKKAFHDEGDEQEVLSKNVDADDDLNNLLVPQKMIKELADELNESEEVVTAIPDQVIHGFKVKPKAPTNFTRVWSSEDTMSREPVSIWAPTLEAGWFAGDKFLACIGHYASDDHKHPIDAWLLRLRNSRGSKDEQKADMVRRFLPFPRRFNQVWNKQLGEDSVTLPPQPSSLPPPPPTKEQVCHAPGPDRAAGLETRDQACPTLHVKALLAPFRTNVWRRAGLRLEADPTWQELCCAWDGGDHH